MSIYPSYKVLPYVYMGIHKTTSKIYIGSRVANKLSSNLDLPIYKTSSKHISPIFDEFDWFIIAEFFNKYDAYNFEQQLIHEQWQVSKEMSLNKFHRYGNKSFNNIGGYKLSDETKLKISNANIGRFVSNEIREKISKSNKGKIITNEHRKKISDRLLYSGIKYSFLTPDGFVIENITMKELCFQFNLNYDSLRAVFRRNKSYKGFTRI